LAAHGLAVAYEVTPLEPGQRALDAVLVSAVYVLLDGAAWLAGQWSNTVRRRTRQMEASRVAAIAAERLRIARELHDIVAHAVTVMVLQAAGASKIMASDPSRARQAMLQVEAVGGQAVEELRRLLHVLRVVGETEPADGSRLPSLAGLPALAARIELTGISVRLDERGSALPVDRSIELTAYRVVQEALTNVVRHVGAGAVATVGIQWRPGELVVEVIDDGTGISQRGTDGLSTGLGLIGLRERIVLMGGEIETGPTKTGGYRVKAVLPAKAPR
jgi:signal transduction histidine kinase